MILSFYWIGVILIDTVFGGDFLDSFLDLGGGFLKFDIDFLDSIVKFFKFACKIRNFISF